MPNNHRAKEAVDRTAVTDPGAPRLNTGQQKISGYRDMSEEEINFINSIKEAGNKLGQVIEELEGKEVDHRWLAIGKTHLQQGIMAVVRSVAKPEGF